MFAAALFACHPLTVEAVTNVVGRADLLAGFSVLGGLWIFARYRQSNGPRAACWLSALALTYLAGVFCKENAVVLPGVLLLYDVAFPPDSPPDRSSAARQPGRRIYPYLALAPGMAALLTVRWMMFRHSPLVGEFGSDNPIAVAPAWTGIMTAVKVAGYYLALVAWPARLSCDYSYNAVTAFGWTFTSGQDPHAWMALTAVLALTVLTAFAWRRDRPLFFFLGFAVATWLPTSNLLFPIGTIMAERLMYLPLAGLTAAAALVLARVVGWMQGALQANAKPRLGAACAVVALAMIAALTVRTIARNEDWTTAARLWESSAIAAPDSIKVIRAQASLVMDSDPSGARAEDALAIAARGLRIVQDAPLPLYHTPAALYEDIGRYHLVNAQRLAAAGDDLNARAASRSAVDSLKRAEAIDQEINRQGREGRIARGARPGDVRDVVTGSIYRNLGAAYLADGEPAKAVATLRYLQRVQPDSHEAQYGLGVAEGALAASEQATGRGQAAQAQMDEAAVTLMVAVLLNPSHEPTWQALDQAYRFLAPSPAAILVENGRPAFNMNHPLVAAHYQEACARLVRQLQAAGLADEAARWRTTLDRRQPGDWYK